MFVGPNLILFIKIIDPAKAKQDEQRSRALSEEEELQRSTFDESLSQSSAKIETFQFAEEKIRQGFEIYTD